MNLPMNLLRPGPGAFALALLLPFGLDDPAKKPGPQIVPLPGGTRGVDAHGGGEDPHEEMAKVFREIERDLREIDRLLSNASAGEAAEGADAKAAEAIAGIDKLLVDSEARSREVIEGIDKLFELADHVHEAGGT